MKKAILIILFFLLFTGIVNAEEKELVAFKSCVDGDTIKVIINGEVETVRLLAIDTPETVKPNTEVQPYGKEASEYTCDKITNAKKIELEYDSGSDKRDKYDRILSWVYVDGSLLESELVSMGYAKVAYIYGDYKYIEDLYELEKQAALEKKGIWSEEEYVSSTTTEEKSLFEEIYDLVLEKVEKWITKKIDDILNSIKKSIEDLINIKI